MSLFCLRQKEPTLRQNSCPPDVPKEYATRRRCRRLTVWGRVVPRAAVRARRTKLQVLSPCFLPTQHAAPPLSSKKRDFINRFSTRRRKKNAQEARKPKTKMCFDSPIADAPQKAGSVSFAFSFFHQVKRSFLPLFSGPRFVEVESDSEGRVRKKNCRKKSCAWSPSFESCIAPRFHFQFGPSSLRRAFDLPILVFVVSLFSFHVPRRHLQLRRGSISFSGLLVFFFFVRRFTRLEG